MFCVLRLSEQVIAFFTFSCVFSFLLLVIILLFRTRRGRRRTRYENTNWCLFFIIFSHFFFIRFFYFPQGRRCAHTSELSLLFFFVFCFNNGGEAGLDLRVGWRPDSCSTTVEHRDKSHEFWTVGIYSKCNFSRLLFL